MSREKDCCPACLSTYEIRSDHNHIVSCSHSSLPCLLPCAHDLCFICIRYIVANQNDITCSVCKEVFPISDDLLAYINKFALGSILVNRIDPKINNEKVRKAVPASLSKANSAAHETTGNCIVCGQSNVMHRCNRCGLLCSKCLDLKHCIAASMDSIEHSVVPLYTLKNSDDHRCLQHNRIKEYFCKEDNKFICASCGFSSEHSGHEIVELTKWKEDNAEIIKDLLEKTLTVNKSVDMTIGHLNGAVKCLSTGSKLAIMGINKEFAKVYNLLQLRQRKLTEELVSATNADSNNLLAMIDEFKNIKSNIDARTLEKNPHLVSCETFHNLLKIDSLKCFVQPFETNFFKTCQPLSKEDILNAFNKLNNVVTYEGLGNFNYQCLSELSEDIKNKIKIESDLNKIPERDITSMSLRPFMAKTDIVRKPVALETIRPIKPPKRPLENSQLSEVTVVNVISPFQFYIRRKQNENNCKSLFASLNEYGSSLAEIKSDLQSVDLDGLVLHKSEEFGWVRSRVIDVINDFELEGGNSSHFKCFLLDYGIVEEVVLNNIWKLPEEFLDAAENAVMCSLHKIQPADATLGWSSESINQFRNFVLNKEVAMKVYETNPGCLSVDIGLGECCMTDGKMHYVPVSVRDALVFLDHGHFPGHSYIEALDFGVKRRYAGIKFPMFDKEIRAQVCHCITPTEFYVQPFINYDAYEVMMITIQKLRLEEMQPLSGPQIGMPCLAKYVDDVWYRAEILSVEKESKIRVVYVDFGNILTLSYKDVRYVDQQFLVLPKQAWCCRLSDVLPSNGKWSSEAIEFFVNQLDQQDVFINVKSMSKKVFSVVLLYLDGDNLANINEQFITKKFGACSGSLLMPTRAKQSRVLEEKSFNDVSHSSLCSETPSALHGLVAQVNDGLEVTVAFADSPSLIYLRNVEANKQFIGLQMHLQQTYLNLRKFEEPCEDNLNWKEGDICAFYNETQSVWCRGQILSIDDQLVKVFAIDIGSKHGLKIIPLKKLPVHLENLKIGIMQCHLSGILPAGGVNWSLLAIEELADLATNNDILMKIMGDEVNGSTPIDLVARRKHIAGALEPTRTIYISFSSALIEKGCALPAVRRQNRLSALPAETQSVKVCSVNVASELYCADGSQDGQKPVESEIAVEPQVFHAIKWKTNNVKLEKGARVIARINAVTREGEIAFNICSNFEEYNAVSSIQHLLNDPDSHSSVYFGFNVGDCCIAKFVNDDGNWHRVRVLQKADASVHSMMVSYVDYGNVREVSQENMRIYTGEEIDLPEQAFFCTLYGTTPVGDKWTLKGSSALSTLILDTSGTIDIMVPETEDRKMQVNFMRMDDDSVIPKVLASFGHVVYEEPKKTYKQKGVLQLNSGTVGVVPTEKEKKVDLPVETCVKLHLQQFVPPNKFYATYTANSCVSGCFNKEILAQLKRLDEITSVMENKADTWPHVLHLENNILCCAFSKAKQRWVRLRVISITNGKQSSEVFLIDYGCTEIIDASGNMLDGVDLFPPQATLYQLYQVVSATKDWDSNVIEILKDMCKSDYVACIRNADSSAVYIDLLKEDECNENKYTLAYNSLVDSGLLQLVRNP